THPTHYTQNSSTRSQQAATRNRGKAIVNSSQPIYDPEPFMVAEDDETSKDKEIDKLMALISLSFKKIYKPSNNNLRTSSNTSRANQDNSLRINKSAGSENQRIGNVAEARETVGSTAGKMLLCKQEEAGIQLNAEQADWRDDTDDDKLEDQELEAYYIEEIDRNDDDNDLANERLKGLKSHQSDILKQYQNEVNEIRAERIARVANPLALVAQQQPVYNPQTHPSQYTQNSSTRSQQAAARNKGKAIVNSPQPIYDQEPSTVAEDDETLKDKEIDKLMALISLSFKKIYKPTNNNLRTLSNSSRANQDNSLRINRNAGYENQRIGNVAGARETVGSTVVQKSEQADWRDDTDDDELEDQEQEAHYMYMAQLQEFSPDAADSGPIFDIEPEQKVSTDDHYNVFAIESEHPEQSKYVHDTYLIEQDEPNVIIDSLDMSYDREEIDQNDDDADLIEAQIKLYKTRKDKELEKVIALENKVKVLDNIVYKTRQSVQTMNMLNNKCRTCFAKPEFLKKAQRANPRLYDIGCYNDNLALILAPESDEVIRLEKESLSKLSDLIRPFDYNKLNNLYDWFIPQREKSSEQRYFSERSRLSHTPVNNGNSRESFYKQTTLLEKWMDESIPNVKFFKNKTSVTACNDSLKAKTLNVNFVCATCGKCVLKEKHDMCVLKFVNGVNSRTKMPIAVHVSTRDPKCTVKQSVTKPIRKTDDSESNQKPKNITRKLYESVRKACSWWYPKFTPSGYKWKPKSGKENVNPNVSISLGSVSRTSNILETTTSRRSTGSNTPLSSNSIAARRDCPIHRTVKFSNDQIAPILGYGDLVQGAITIKWVYYVEGLNHNLFSVGQFCNVDLEIAFRKSTCYIRDLKGNDLLTGSRGTDLYSITLQDTNFPNPICLMAKATSSQAWLWHRHLSHLNFDTINLLSKNDIVVRLPKLKFVNDHLCSFYELGKAKRKSFHTKITPSSKRRLQLLHMDLCGPMRVASINGEKYVLVIVDDYSRYTWTYFLRSKDETPEVLIDFLRIFQKGLQAQLRIVRTDKGTKFLNQTLHVYFDVKGILHQTSVAQTPKQNGIVKRWNRTLVEAARTMLSAAKVSLFFWAEAIAIACFTQNHGENLDNMKEKCDACIFVGYSTQSRAYRVFNKRTRVIVETIHVNFNELPQMASDHVSFDPVPECQRMALEHGSLSLGPQCQENVTQADGTVTTSNELDLLFSLMFDELLNGSSKVVSKSSAVYTADAPNQRQHHTTPLNTHTTPAPKCQVPTQAPTVASHENINQAGMIEEYAQVENDAFINM
nr:hypothetical protein [Tanacetum cinerariifolium]